MSESPPIQQELESSGNTYSALVSCINNPPSFDLISWIKASPLVMAPATANATSNHALGLLPPTINIHLLTAGDAALYNTTLLTLSVGLALHGLVFGLIFLLRSFDVHRALDLHFLTIVFALTLLVAPLLFILDPHVNAPLLFFFLQHEAVELLIAIRVLAPKVWCQRHPGLVLFSCWIALATVSTLVAFDDKIHHAAEIVSWGAFVSDALIAVTGAFLVTRWIYQRRQTDCSDQISSRNFTTMAKTIAKTRRRLLIAEGWTGLGFVVHGRFHHIAFDKCSWSHLRACYNASFSDILTYHLQPNILTFLVCILLGRCLCVYPGVHRSICAYRCDLFFNDQMVLRSRSENTSWAGKLRI